MIYRYLERNGESRNKGKKKESKRVEDLIDRRNKIETRLWRKKAEKKTRCKGKRREFTGERTNGSRLKARKFFQSLTNVSNLKLRSPSATWRK